MQLTKFTHSCVRMDDGDRAVVIDPGVFSEVEEALDGVQAVLITHEHADHLDIDRVRAAAQRDPRLRIGAPESVATSLASLGEQVVTIAPGDRVDVAGFSVWAFGGQHALIHATIPVVANVGYLIDESVYHPGDSFFVPPLSVPTLLLPLHAPWSKTAEVIDFVISVRARRVHQIHDGILNDIGIAMVEGHVSRLGAQHGSEFAHLRTRESVSI